MQGYVSRRPDPVVAALPPLWEKARGRGRSGPTAPPARLRSFARPGRGIGERRRI